MNHKPESPTAAQWARFRFSVIGSLLSSPPARGQLKTAMRALAETIWTHPVHGCSVQFATATIERWYYMARHEKDDPVAALRRAVRKDSGKVSLAPAVAEKLLAQYEQYSHWTYQLHYDNLLALIAAQPSLGPLRSYSTVRRYMRAHGMLRRPRPAPKESPGEQRARVRREMREIRSYEAEYVGSLWHFDFHHGSLKIVTEQGHWLRPIALGILDDHSRLCCHLQWYLSEAAEDLVHGLSQAIQKRGLPRSAMSDNGAAMVAEEVVEGMLRLGILHERTLPYSPYQNGKQEAFWGVLEGRLMRMLEGQVDLKLDFLNQVTQAWVEIEYNRAVHREIGVAPVERFAKSPDVLRASPSSEALRSAFRLQTTRRVRRSDGTISLEGLRFEIPSRYRQLRDVTVHYARWDLGRVDLVDPQSGVLLTPIYPLDRAANADGRRSVIQLGGAGAESDKAPRAAKELPPLLTRILQEYSATGLPPAYLPKQDKDTGGNVPHSDDQ